MKFYKSLDTLPIWNWYQIHKTGDFRYLLKTDYDKLPSIPNLLNIELAKTYQNLMYDFETINAPLLKQKRNIAVKIISLVIEIMTEGKDFSKIEKANTILSALLITDNPNIDWLYDVDFTDSAKQKDLLTHLAIEIKKYDVQKESKTEPQTLTDKTVKIEITLGIVIDIYTCSVLKYDSYERAAIEKIKWQQANK